MTPQKSCAKVRFLWHSSCIKQRLDTVFHMVKDGNEIHFNLYTLEQ